MYLDCIRRFWNTAAYERYKIYKCQKMSKNVKKCQKITDHALFLFHYFQKRIKLMR